jgi:hypothetical protein
MGWSARAPRRQLHDCAWARRSMPVRLSAGRRYSRSEDHRRRRGRRPASPPARAPRDARRRPPRVDESRRLTWPDAAHEALPTPRNGTGQRTRRLQRVRRKPSAGLEPATPSLPSKVGCPLGSRRGSTPWTGRDANDLERPEWTRQLPPGRPQQAVRVCRSRRSAGKLRVALSGTWFVAFVSWTETVITALFGSPEPGLHDGGFDGRHRPPSNQPAGSEPTARKSERASDAPSVSASWNPS